MGQEINHIHDLACLQGHTSAGIGPICLVIEEIAVEPIQEVHMG